MSIRKWCGFARLVVLASALFAAPSIAAAQDGDRGELPELVTLPAGLSAVLRGYEAAWGRRDAEALADLFTPDGFVLRPGHPPAHGREEILEAYATSGGPLTLRAYDYSVEGDVGFIVGGYSSSPDRLESGKFVLALRRHASGRWLIAADIDNGN